MTEMTLAASLRDGRGKNKVRKLRQQGLVPGIVYGLVDPVPVQMDERTVTRLVHQLRGGGRLVALQISDGGKETPTEKHVLFKEVQTTPVGGRLVHVDFQEVNVNETVQVSVEVRSKGRAAGEKLGGILQTVSHAVMIECLPAIIPEVIEVDVSVLEIGHSLHVKDLVLAEGVKAISPPEDTVFVVTAPSTEEAAEVTPAAAEPAAGAAPGKEKAESKEQG